MCTTYAYIYIYICLCFLEISNLVYMAGGGEGEWREDRAKIDR